MRFVTTSTILLHLVLVPASALALTGQAGDEADRQTSFQLTTARTAEDHVSTLQWAVPQSPHGFSLAGQGLLGRYGLTATEVLKELAPHLEAVSPRLEKSSGHGQTVHEFYALHFGDYPLAGATLNLHHHLNKLAMVRASLPTYRLPAKPFTAQDFVALDALGYGPTEGERQSSRAVVAESGGFPAPAWEISRFSEATGATSKLLVDAQTGALLSSVQAAFDLAEVFEKGPADGKTVTVELPDLPGTGYLDGKRFSVFAPTASDPRVMAPDNQFVFRADDPADALSFDQVEAYYSATRALAWFQQRFGNDGGGAHLTVRINHLIAGRSDNALYVPPPEGPEIRIGAGNEVMTNLARDTDVLTHEYAHHVIFEHLKEHAGESGVLHEGTADYFAYAVNGDPNLGESLIPGGPYLRTAALDADARYDLVDERRGAHFRGQYWSAVLWSLRQELGEGFDTVVYNALSYLGPGSGLKDGFLGLLNADRDLNPLDAASPEAGVFGKNKCLILKTGVERGFAAYLEDYEGFDCGLDLAALAQESKALTTPAAVEGKGKPVEFTAFGKRCAVVSANGSPGQVATAGWFWVPLLFVLWLSRRGRKHGS